MAHEGTLKDVPLADVVQFIQMQKKTGILHLRRGQESVDITFDKGMVVLADESQRTEQDRLGSILMKARLITPEQLQEAIALKKSTIQKLGFILVNNNFMSQEQLRGALQMQVRETVFRVFRWEDGEFRFSQEPVTYDATLYQPQAADFLTMEGIRRIDEMPLIKKQIPSMAIIFDTVDPGAARTPRPAAKAFSAEGNIEDILSFVDGGRTEAEPAAAGGPELSTAEATVLRLIDGKRSVQDLADESRLGEFEASKALVGLLAQGLIRKVGEAAPVKPSLAGVGHERRRRTALALVIGTALFLACALLSPVGLPLSWFNSAAERAALATDVDAARLERIRFALESYHLQRHAYPERLADLVDAKFVSDAFIRSHAGAEFDYRSLPDGFTLAAPATPAAR
jgi:predicted transcriptional regulator